MSRYSVRGPIGSCEGFKNVIENCRKIGYRKRWPGHYKSREVIKFSTSGNSGSFSCSFRLISKEQHSFTHWRAHWPLWQMKIVENYRSVDSGHDKPPLNTSSTGGSSGKKPVAMIFHFSFRMISTIYSVIGGSIGSGDRFKNVVESYRFVQSGHDKSHLSQQVFDSQLSRWFYNTNFVFSFQLV